MRTIAKRSSYYVVGIVTVILALIILSPILYCLAISFMNPSEINSYPPKIFPNGLYLGNYISLFANSIFFRFVLNSLAIALVCTIMRIATSSLAAFSFSFLEFPFKKVLFSIILGSMVIPGDALIISNYLTVSSLGLLDTYLGVMIIYFASAMDMFMFRQFMRTIPNELRDAAVMDGCGNFKFFSSIIMPICQPVIASIFISSFVGLWNAYIWPLLVTNTPEMRTIQVGITMLSTDENVAYGQVMSGSIIVLIPVIILFILGKDRIISGITAGSIKG